jgi:hypothetical protein
MLANGENNNKMGEEEEDEHDACFQQDIKKGRRRPKSLPATVPFFFFFFPGSLFSTLIRNFRRFFFLSPSTRQTPTHQLPPPTMARQT